MVFRPKPCCTVDVSGRALWCTLFFMQRGGGGGMPLLHADRRCIPRGNTQSCHLLPRARARIRGNILIKPSSFPRGSSSLSPSSPSPLLSPQPSSRPTCLLSPHSRLSVPRCENLQRQRQREEGEDGGKSNVNVLVENKMLKRAQDTSNKVIMQIKQPVKLFLWSGNKESDGFRKSEAKKAFMIRC